MFKNFTKLMKMEKNNLLGEVNSQNHTIETNELANLIKSNHINEMRILDCSWYLPMENKNAREMYMKQRIPYAQYIDMDEIADLNCQLPHMMPDEETFTYHMKEMDIRKTDHIFCYDMSGMFSAPRIWFTFKVFGVDNVYVLNGGFPKWVKEELPVETGDNFSVKSLKRDKPKEGDFNYKLDKQKLVNLDKILELSLRKQNKLTDEHIIDCRSSQRFLGEVEEPRPTLRRGHIEAADNVFFKDLLNQNSCFKSESELKNEFAKRNIDISKPMTLYCGTGATACVDILALSLLGKYDNCRLYDGSWSEMGNTPDEVLKEKISKLKL